MNDATTSPGAIILLYHRVTTLETDPQLLAVTPRNFEDQLDLLNRTARPISMRQLVADVRADRVAERSVVITFDDGYSDNLHEAKPILETFGIPATVFCTTGHTGTNREFYWDDLDRIFLHADVLPRELRVTSEDREHVWHLDNHATLDSSRSKQSREWDVTQSASPTMRQVVYRELSAIIHKLPADRREALMRQVRAWAGVAEEGRSSHRMMNEEELRDLAQGDLVEVAAHTVNHPLLSAESIDRQRHELRESKRRLEEIVGREVVGFSYPFGTRRDYVSDTVRLAREAGFAYSCSNFQGRATGQSDLHQLPRFLVRDWSADAFERRLREWWS